MRCPRCEGEGLPSRVSEGMSTVTLMAFARFWDEDDRLHIHDPNTHSTEYHCSQGHSFGEGKRYPCPVDGCSWNERLAS